MALSSASSFIEVACYAHLRRYFFKALDSDPERARQALGLIGELFRIERTIVGAREEARKFGQQPESSHQEAEKSG